MDRVTVVTVCFNAEREIEDTMRSVCNQNYPDIEYLVIDGASTDRTLDISTRIKNEYNTSENLKIHIVSEPDKGIYDAMNKGIDMATGTWLLFMNAGDFFYNTDVISRMFQKSYNGEIKAIYGDSERFFSESKKIVHAGNLNDIAKGIPLPFCHQAVFVRTEILRDLHFNTNYRQASDYDFFVRCYLRGYTFEHIDLVVCRYDMTGISGRNNIRQLKEKMDIREENGLERYPPAKRAILVARLKMRGFIKKLLPYSIIKRVRGY